MEGSVSNIMNPSDRNDLGGPPMVIQQYARYPSTLEPGLQSASSLGSARSQLATSNSPPLHRKATPRSLQASPTGLRPVLPASVSRSGPSMSPPVFDPLRQRQSRDAVDQTDTRSLPSREITDQTIDDAYVMFIFYCNPYVPLSADTSELRKTFRCPPRSDGKSFSIFTLYELIRKLDTKELKTWHALAIELGVEPPVIEQKQSTQKVQQYAVRLKRWLRAMHVDAFFEYCLGHPHPYYTQLPPGHVPMDTRDGVPLEEDLALRALMPQWKPKRGRKRAEEREIVSERSVKRPQLDTSVGVLRAGSFPASSTTFPQSAIPFSAFPEEIEANDPWIAPQPSFPAEGSSAPPAQDPRWRPIERAPSPPGYPHSAIIPRGQHPSEVFLPPTEPRSAVTPTSGEKTRPKRRHGPAVSSAWPSTNGSSSGKARGRPPNKGTVSGPFSSFPVDPSRSGPGQPQNSGSSSSPAIIVDQDPSNRLSQSQYSQSPTPYQAGRPSKLQLQVPQHAGAPVRLATPPMLMVNGVNNASFLKVEGTPQSVPAVPPTDASGRSVSGDFGQPNLAAPDPPQVTPDDVIRILTSELTRAKLSGRSVPLGPEESRNLAISIVQNLMASYSQSSSGITPLMAALHLGLGQHFGYAGGTDRSISIDVHPVSTAPSSMSGTPGANGSPTNLAYTVSHEYRHGLSFSTKVIFGDIVFGRPDGRPENGPRTTDELEHSTVEPDSLTDAEFEVDAADGAVSEMTWKQRYMKLRAQLHKKERALSQYKRKILESVMADI
ncbi:ARS binding protein 2-domain-containing protein [Aspergillus ambiguus]|uniref:putative ARS binding protein Abp2 n=1 Tax=Aspergillus ambiguus TaxID=176160 RepID=UPI003CCDA166